MGAGMYTQKGWMLHHDKYAPQGEYSSTPLGEDDRKYGWTARPMYINVKDTPK